MKTTDYFNAELHVHFTCSELHSIMHALAEYSFNEENAGRHCNSDVAWFLREKVKSFVESYDK